jgi:hypothetical protein
METIVKCHVTHEEYTIEIPTSVGDVAKYWRQTVATACPHCGQEHVEGFKQLYAQAALGGGAWRDVFEAPPPPGARRSQVR